MITHTFLGVPYCKYSNFGGFRILIMLQYTPKPCSTLTLRSRADAAEVGVRGARMGQGRGTAGPKTARKGGGAVGRAETAGKIKGAGRAARGGGWEMNAKSGSGSKLSGCGKGRYLSLRPRRILEALTVTPCIIIVLL